MRQVLGYFYPIVYRRKVAALLTFLMVTLRCSGAAASHDAVNVVAWREGEDSAQADGAAEIFMVRQYRHPVRAMLWEISAGLLDVAGEDPLTAARRELERSLPPPARRRR